MDKIELKLVLASRSPQRVRLMRDAGLSFDIAPADIDESVYPATLSPDAVARHLALAKARHVAGVDNADKYVIGADTIVVVGDAVLGKPIDAADALRMLRMMSETTQHVITGLAIVNAMRDIEHVEHVVTDVTMRRLSDADIYAYVRSDQWQGKAGGYGIQDTPGVSEGVGDAFVTSIHGPMSNVIGLPIERLLEQLRELSQQHPT